MSERRSEILQEFKRPPNNKSSSRSKDLKNRLTHYRSKQTFLTDTQNSDNTRSSAEMNLSQNEKLQQTVRKLQKENEQLRQYIVELKANQFFQVNQQKVKSIIKEAEGLRQQLQATKKQLEQSYVERDFLERFNKNLKIQCEALTKEIMLLKGCSSPKNAEKSIYLSRETQSSKNRNSQYELRIPVKRKQGMKVQKEQDSGSIENRSLLKTSLSTSRLHQDYLSRRSRHKAFKNL